MSPSLMSLHLAKALDKYLNRLCATCLSRSMYEQPLDNRLISTLGMLTDEVSYPDSVT